MNPIVKTLFVVEQKIDGEWVVATENIESPAKATSEARELHDNEAHDVRVRGIQKVFEYYRELSSVTILELKNE